MADTKKLVKDNYLFREGDPPDAMYIVKTGGLVITKTKGNSEVILAELGPGSMVGEMALFDRKPRSANVKASKETEVIALPYDSLNAQLEQMPVWLKAVLKNLNENLRDANKKIKSLETPNQEEERFPPHIINKYLSIINLVGFKYGKANEQGHVSFSSDLIRNYTIQIFQEATNKMKSILTALTELGYLQQEDTGNGSQKITNLKPLELFAFVDWYNEWLFKQEKDRLALLREDETKVLNGILYFARKIEPDVKGFRKINLYDVQNDSMKELNFLIKPDDTNSLIEKKYLSEKIMDEKGLYLVVKLEEVESYAKNWTLVNNFKKKLR